MPRVGFGVRHPGPLKSRGQRHFPNAHISPGVQSPAEAQGRKPEAVAGPREGDFFPRFASAVVAQRSRASSRDRASASPRAPQRDLRRWYPISLHTLTSLPPSLREDRPSGSPSPLSPHTVAPPARRTVGPHLCASLALLPLPRLLSLSPAGNQDRILDLAWPLFPAGDCGKQFHRFTLRGGDEDEGNEIVRAHDG